MQNEEAQKQFYEAAEMEIVAVAQDDIICTSPGSGSNEGFDDLDDI